MGVVKVRVEAEEDVDGEDGGAAAEDVNGEGATGGSIQCAAGAAADAGVEREDDCSAYEEEKVGEYEVGKGEAVPGGVIELGEGVGPVSGIVDEDHEGDGDAAEDVDGEDAGGGSRV